MRLQKYIIQELNLATDIKFNTFRNTGTEYWVDIIIDDENFDYQARKIPSANLRIQHIPIDKLMYIDEKLIDDVWDIQFFDKDGNADIQPKGEGIALRLFTAIERVTKMFVAKYRPKVFYFTGYNNEPSRIKLYNLLSKKIQKNGYKEIMFRTPMTKGWLFYKIYKTNVTNLNNLLQK